MTTGTLAVKYLKSLANGGGIGEQAAAYAERQDNWTLATKAVIGMRLKAGIAGLQADDFLNGGDDDIGDDFLQALRPQSLIGKLPLRRVAPRVPMLTGETGTVAHWIRQGAAVKLSAGSYTREAGLQPLKVAALTVCTNEALALESIDTEAAILADLVAAVREAVDSAFVNPSNAGEVGVSPASITNGLTAIPVVGGTIAGIETAIRQAMQNLSASGGDLQRATWIMHPTTSSVMATTRTASGDLAWPGVSAVGGMLAGLPLLTSPGLEADSDGYHLVLLDPMEISYVETMPNLSTSQSALIELDDQPTADSTVPTAGTAHRVSMFQSECTALLASLSVAWKARRSGVVQLISNVPSTIGA